MPAPCQWLHHTHVRLFIGAVRGGPIHAGADGGQDQLAIAAGHVMRHQDLPQEVIPADRLAAGPEDEQDSRRADALAGMQLAMHKLLARLGGERATGRPLETRLPLPGPADRHRHAAVTPRQVEERHLAVGGSPANGREDQFLRALRRQDILHRRETLARVLLPHRVMDDDVRLCCGLEPGIQGENSLKNWRVLGPAVLEVEHPLDGGKAVILRQVTANAQRRRGISASERALGAARLPLCRRALQFPCGEQLRGSATAVCERKGESAGFGVEMLRHPLTPQLNLRAGGRRGT